MTETTVETIEAMLSSVVEETEDPEAQFKLRTALQLLIIVEEREKEAMQTLGEAELPDDVNENLRELGYLS